jgi:general secretion pathway protein G
MTQNVRNRDATTVSLIEIMAVVLIIGLLTAVVGTAIFGQIDRARVTAAKTQMKNIEAALDFYRMDSGRYPTTEQGLDALVHQPSTEPVPRQYRPEGYISGGRVPRDPWGRCMRIRPPGSVIPTASTSGASAPTANRWQGRRRRRRQPGPRTRLHESRESTERENAGFTLIEMLVAVAIRLTPREAPNTTGGSRMCAAMRGPRR